jgi:hypothetical protein
MCVIFKLAHFHSSLSLPGTQNECLCSDLVCSAGA